MDAPDVHALMGHRHRLREVIDCRAADLDDVVDRDRPPGADLGTQIAASKTNAAEPVEARFSFVLEARDRGDAQSTAGITLSSMIAVPSNES